MCMIFYVVDIVLVITQTCVLERSLFVCIYKSHRYRSLLTTGRENRRT